MIQDSDAGSSHQLPGPVPHLVSASSSPVLGGSALQSPCSGPEPRLAGLPLWSWGCPRAVRIQAEQACPWYAFSPQPARSTDRWVPWELGRTREKVRSASLIYRWETEAQWGHGSPEIPPVVRSFRTLVLWVLHYFKRRLLENGKETWLKNLYIPLWKKKTIYFMVENLSW